MAKVKVGVAGYGVIGQRLADGVALQGDMELVGVADVAPTLSVRALKAKVRMADGFLGNASMFRWARDLGNPRGDMYESRCGKSLS